MTKTDGLFSLQGKTILVSGASGHLGRAMTVAIAEAGARVLVNSRSLEKCDAIVAELLSRGLQAEPAIFDVTDSAAVLDYFSARSAMALHGLINNAYSGVGGTIASANEEQYLQSYQIGVVSAHGLLRAALPCLRKAVQETGDASVINIGSMYGIVSPDKRIYEEAGVTNPPFYGAAKAALLQWTRYAACEFGSESIRINAISPGPFPSNIVQKNDGEFIRRLANKVPLGRVGTPDEIRGPIIFLLSLASTYVNGANLIVDGGWTTW